ncbi:MAG: glycosyltransferase family 2 protein [Rhodopirellula sp.]|nr:glycosyltransferase family 2 protein [Rhodopirellula sp.]
MSVSLVAVTLIKDEADIILASLKNLYGLGIRMFAVMDNDSSDETLQHVHQFRSLHADASVLIVHDYDRNHFQSKKVTAMSRMAIDYFSATHVYPFDADEFLRPIGTPSISSDSLLAKIAGTDLKANCAISIPWRTCIPADGGHFHKCTAYSTLNKVLVRMTSAIRIAEGNHGALTACTNWRGRSKCRKCPNVALNGYEVLHVPVRSAEQLRSKILNGAAANQINQGTGYSAHWMALHKAYVKDGDAVFDRVFEMLQRGIESELEEFCRTQRIDRQHLCYFNDYFLPRTSDSLDLS